MQKLYYVDTSIWLNLFKKEGDPTRGVPYWKIAEDFVSHIVRSPDKKIVYTGVVLRELEIHLHPKEYYEKRLFIENGHECLKIDILTQDRKDARKLESLYMFTISFYDLLHLSIAKRIGAILITRDKQLIEVCKENMVKVAKPENIINYSNGQCQGFLLIIFFVFLLLLLQNHRCLE